VLHITFYALCHQHFDYAIYFKVQTFFQNCISFSIQVYNKECICSVRTVILHSEYGLVFWYHLWSVIQDFTLSNARHEIRKRKAKWTGHISRRNCLLKQVIKGKIKGEMEVTRRWERRCRKLLDDLKDRRGYSHLEEALDHIMWRRLWTCCQTEYWINARQNVHVISTQWIYTTWQCCSFIIQQPKFLGEQGQLLNEDLLGWHYIVCKRAKYVLLEPPASMEAPSSSKTYQVIKIHVHGVMS